MSKSSTKYVSRRQLANPTVEVLTALALVAVIIAAHYMRQTPGF